MRPPFRSLSICVAGVSGPMTSSELSAAGAALPGKEGRPEWSPGPGRGDVGVASDLTAATIQPGRELRRPARAG